MININREKSIEKDLLEYPILMRIKNKIDHYCLIVDCNHNAIEISAIDGSFSLYGKIKDIHNKDLYEILPIGSSIVIKNVFASDQKA